MPNFIGILLVRVEQVVSHHLDFSHDHDRHACMTKTIFGWPHLATKRRVAETNNSDLLLVLGRPGME